MTSTTRPRNRFVLVCDHCGDCYHRRFGAGRKMLEPFPPGWRRVGLDEGDAVTECPDCAIAWDLEQWRRKPIRAPLAGVRPD